MEDSMTVDAPLDEAELDEIYGGGREEAPQCVSTQCCVN